MPQDAHREFSRGHAAEVASFLVGNTVLAALLLTPASHGAGQLGDHLGPWNESDRTFRIAPPAGLVGSRDNGAESANRAPGSCGVTRT